jgi:glycosylphosphatidylinositol transamidase (GPIT) subunit GPI8
MEKRLLVLGLRKGPPVWFSDNTNRENGAVLFNNPPVWFSDNTNRENGAVLFNNPPVWFSDRHVKPIVKTVRCYSTIRPCGFQTTRIVKTVNI